MYGKCAYWHMWMRHVTYERVRARVNTSCRIWIHHALCEWWASIGYAAHVYSRWVTAQANEACHEWMSHGNLERVISLHMNASCYSSLNSELLQATQSVLQCDAVCCSVLQCVAVCCRVLQGVAVCCSVLQCVAVCCRVLQCVAVCCSVLRQAMQSTIHMSIVPWLT